MKKLTYLLAFAAIFAFTAAPASAQPIEDTFNVTFNATGAFVEGGGTGYNGGEWYFYENTGWWNEWFYDHPFDDTRYKVIHIVIDVTEFQAGPIALQFVVNWSTPEWSLVGNPEPEPRIPPLPPLSPPDEELYIGRELLELIEAPGHYEYDFIIPDYNPEWVSIDVQGTNFVIPLGIITHECRGAIPTVSEWGLVVMTLLVLASGTVVFRRFRVAAA